VPIKKDILKPRIIEIGKIRDMEIRGSGIDLSEFDANHVCST